MGVRGGCGRTVAGLAAVCVMLSACSRASYSPQPLQPPPRSVIGVASWYGPGFNGHKTASGEVYNQEELTAASSRYPLGTRVMVTNLDNNRSVEVRINDRGPFVREREIDLSHHAAQVLGLMKPGTAPVRIDLVGTPDEIVAAQRPPTWSVQVGAFSAATNAEHLRNRLAESWPDVRIDEVSAGNNHYYRVRMGSFQTRGEAASRADKSANLGLPIVIVSE